LLDRPSLLLAKLLSQRGRQPDVRQLSRFIRASKMKGNQEHLQEFTRICKAKNGRTPAEVLFDEVRSKILKPRS
jgi:hypothetical protein